MKNILLKLSLTVLIISHLILPGPLVFAKSDRTGGRDDRVTISTDLDYVTQADIAEIMQEVRLALDSISRVLGTDTGKTTEIRIIDSGICNAVQGIISLPISHVRDKDAVIIHEVTHTIAGHKDNSFFSEGLAVYFQQRFGHKRGFPYFSDPLDKLVQDYQSQLVPISELMGDSTIFSRVETEQRRIAYIEAGSFIGFLADRFGEEKLAELHNSLTLDYKQIYGRSVDELEAEWKNYILRTYR